MRWSLWFQVLLGAMILLLPGFADGLKAQNLVITEFMAANTSGLKDEDGEFSDWIEIYNPDPQPASLRGWYLSNDPKNVTQWMLPDLALPAQSLTVIFASGKDRRDPTRKLHTNFKLNRDGEYLALTRPDGHTIASEFAPAFPRQLSNISYGPTMNARLDRLVPADATARVFWPDDGRFDATWTRPDFDDATWGTVQMGLGFDRTPISGGDPPEPVSQLADVSQPSDVVVPTSMNSPANEDVAKAIDNNTRTKYLNFDKLEAGFTLSPAAGPTIVAGLRLTSANDVPDRDPTSYALFGSDDGRAFVEIARGKIPDFSARFTAVEVAFTNRVAYRQYRLLFPTVRNAAVATAVQIAEIEFLGRVGSTSLSLVELLTSNVETAMFGRHSSVFLRFPFTRASPLPVERPALRIRFEDGFAAFLNGVKVASSNAPNPLAFNSTASTNRPRSQAEQEQRVDLRPFANLIRPGTNVLAVQGLNDRPDSADFLLQVQLENAPVTLGPNGYFETPTPGSENGPGTLGLVSDLAIDRPHGFYEIPLDVTMTCPTAGASIRFTTDGSAPTATNGLAYAGPMRVDRTTVLRAAGFREGWRPSRVATRTYLFLNDVITQNQTNILARGFPAAWNGRAADYGLDPRVVGPMGQDSFGGKYSRTIKADLQGLPALSLVMNRSDMFGPQGLYSNPERRGAAWERPVSLELIYPDSRAGFQEDAGLRIQGGAFRRFDLSLKKSFRVVFRDEYGSATLRFPFFGGDAADTFNNIVLRANSNDAWPYGGSRAVYVRDAFAMETARALGMVASHSTFVHLFINGLYWGLYNPVERPDAAFSATYLGGERDTWDALNQDSVPDGNADAWNRLLALLNQDMSRTETYQRAQGNNPDGTRNPAFEDLLEVDNMIDYLILNFYVGNTDWPGRNWWVGRNRNNGDGFHFYPWDTETALGFSGNDANVTGVNSAVARPYAAARANADFRLRFADHVQRHFFEGGALYVNPAKPQWDPAHPENNRPAARFAALAEPISRAIVGESARWGDQLRNTPSTRDEHWQRERDNLLTNYFPRRSATVLDQFRQANLFPRLAAPSMNQRGGLVTPGFKLTLSAPQGSIFYTTNGSDPRTPALLGALLYTGPIELRDLTTVKARTASGQEWSALIEATFIAGRPILALTELHYHPAPASAAEQAAGFTNADDFEFIEFCNRGTATLDLTGVRIITGVQFDFTGSSISKLGPGKYLLVVKNRAAFERRSGTGWPIAGEYSGKLDNAGERIELVNAAGESLLTLDYGTRAPWPEAADGAGPSLVVIDPSDNLNSPANWRVSVASGGSPGGPEIPNPLSLEVLIVNSAQIRFQFDGEAGIGYTVYARDNLSSGDWRVFERGAPLPQSQKIEVTIDAHQASARFFQVSIP